MVAGDAAFNYVAKAQSWVSGGGGGGALQWVSMPIQMYLPVTKNATILN